MIEDYTELLDIKSKEFTLTVLDKLNFVIYHSSEFENLQKRTNAPTEYMIFSNDLGKALYRLHAITKSVLDDNRFDEFLNVNPAQVISDNKVLTKDIQKIFDDKITKKVSKKIAKKTVNIEKPKVKEIEEEFDVFDDIF